MPTIQPPPKTQRLKVGGPAKVLIVVEPPSLMLRMGEVVRSTEGAQLQGAHATATDAIDWLVWERPDWHLAYVDLGLPEGGGTEVIRRLLGAHRPGVVVGVSNHLWREVRQACAALGVYHIVEKGDLVAFRGDLEQRVR